MTEYVGRKLSLDEEIEIYQKEAKELFDNEQKGCETPFANCIVRRGMRIISKSKEIREKFTPKKPDYEGDGYDENGNLIYDTWICPNCGKHYEVDYDNYDFCPECGQALDWSDKE